MTLEPRSILSLYLVIHFHDILIPGFISFLFRTLAFCVNILTNIPFRFSYGFRTVRYDSQFGKDTLFAVNHDFHDDQT